MPNLHFLSSSLVDWYQQPLGSSLIELEQKYIEEITGKSYGRYLLQLGHSQLFTQLKTNPVTHHLIVDKIFDIQTKISYANVCYETLPFAEDQFNLVFLPHTLEFEKNPELIIKECWRVLAAEGQLLILGFNPWSLWGIKNFLSSAQSASPWHGHFHSAGKLCRWVHQLGGEILQAKSFFYRPPVSSVQRLDKLKPMEEILPWLLPQIGGVYLLLAQKHVPPLTLIKPRWHWQTVLPNKLAIPTVGRIQREHS